MASLSLAAVQASEIHSPRLYSDATQRPYGLLYHNVQNPLSYDSNHAVVLDLESDIGSALDDIASFYRSLHITPRVYTAFQAPKEEQLLLPLLQEHGYALSRADWHVLAWQCASEPSSTPPLEVRRVRALDDPVIALINAEEPQPWNVGLLQRYLASECLHLLVGYHHSEPICMAALRILDGISRVDDVQTHPAWRGRGYARALMQYLVRYHQEVSSNALYLLTDNPTALRVYRDVGFAATPFGLSFWSAWLEDHPTH